MLVETARGDSMSSRNGGLGIWPVLAAILTIQRNESSTAQMSPVAQFGEQTGPTRVEQDSRRDPSGASLPGSPTHQSAVDTSGLRVMQDNPYEAPRSLGTTPPRGRARTTCSYICAIMLPLLMMALHIYATRVFPVVNFPYTDVCALLVAESLGVFLLRRSSLIAIVIYVVLMLPMLVYFSFWFVGTVFGDWP